MCISFFGLDVGEDIAFVLAFNRDEYIDRPTLPFHAWKDLPVWGGRDEQAHGTWLCLSESGRAAWVTNHREKDPVEPTAPGGHHKKTRGGLAVDFVTGDQEPLEFCRAVRGGEYHGFNLVVVDIPGRKMVYATNGSPATHPLPVQLAAGELYGVSNGRLNEWPKVETGLAAMQQLLAGATAEAFPAEAVLAGVLRDEARIEALAPQHGRPARLPEDLEYLTSSRFIPVEPTPYGPYGTRSQTLLVVGADGTARVEERFIGEGGAWRSVAHTFQCRVA